jgi:hypothetical protein
MIGPGRSPRRCIGTAVSPHDAVAVDLAAGLPLLEDD